MVAWLAFVVLMLFVFAAMCGMVVWSVLADQRQARLKAPGFEVIQTEVVN